MTDGWGISCKIALKWMPLDLIDDKSTLVQVMAWCRQATSHYLSQCWLSSLLPYGVARPQWVNAHDNVSRILPMMNFIWCDLGLPNHWYWWTEVWYKLVDMDIFRKQTVQYVILELMLISVRIYKASVDLITLNVDPTPFSTFKKNDFFKNCSYFWSGSETVVSTLLSLEV